uniref:RNA-guided endonuclease TnpB family protein n=1 Tax=Siminovitchia terrae TaxID=1914933 RepID=UPI0035E42F18
MLRHKAYKFRIYPTKEQEIFIAKTIGCSRFVYNHFLHRWNTTYAKTGKGLSYEACSALLPQMKQEEATCWLKEVDSTALQSSLKNLADSFSRFFKKQNHRPKFKSKKNPVQSYTTKNVNNSIELKEKHVKLPKLKPRLAKQRTVGTTGIAWFIRETAVGKEIRQQVCSLPKNLVTLVMRGSNGDF